METDNCTGSVHMHHGLRMVTTEFSAEPCTQHTSSLIHSHSCLHNKQSVMVIRVWPVRNKSVGTSCHEQDNQFCASEVHRLHQQMVFTSWKSWFATHTSSKVQSIRSIEQCMIIACYSTLDVHWNWELKRNRSHYHAHDARIEMGVENYLLVDADTG